MATTFDKTGCGPLLGAISFNSLNKVYVLSNEVDLSAATLVTTDVYQCLAIPADTLVMMVKIEIITGASAAALTCTVGDGSAANGWDAAVDLDAAAGTFTTSVNSTDTYGVEAAMGKFYDAADSIDITLATVTTVVTGPVIRVYALCADFNP